MSSPARILAVYLDAEGLGSFPAASGADWAMFVGLLPNSPDNALHMVDVGGLVEPRLHRHDDDLNPEFSIKPSWQIILRSKDYQEGYEKCEAILAAFAKIRQTMVVADDQEYLVHAVKMTSAIAYLGLEQGGKRHKFSLNGRVTL